MRIKRLLLALSLSLIVGKSFAISFKMDGISYVANADTAIIKGYSEIPENGELSLASKVSHGGKDYRVTTIQANAFLSCTEIKKLIVPAGIKYIQSGAFENCVNMASLVLSEGDDQLDAAEDAFRNCGIVEATLGRNLRKSIFKNSGSLVKVNFGENIRVVGAYAFIGCSKLSSINLERIEQIDNSAFLNCTSLKQVKLENVKTIADCAFSQSGLEEIALPASLESLSSHVFEYSLSLKKAMIGGSIAKIPDNCFRCCNSLVEVVYPASVTEIGDNAFESSGLASFKFLDAVRIVGCNAFSLCKNLTSVEWGYVNLIKREAFYGCGFNELNLPSSLTDIDENAFKSCANLKKVDLSKTKVTEIGCFSSCSSLQEVVFPEKLTEIGRRCFEYCSSLELIVLPKSVNEISYSAFSGVEKLREMDLSGTSVSYIPECCFNNCKALTKVTLNAKTDTIGASAFAGCVNLVELKNTDKISLVYARAFDNTKLFDAISEGPIMVGSVLYQYKGKIEDKEYVVPENVTCISEKAFADQQFQTIKLNSKLRYIGKNAFENCSELISLDIPSSVRKVYGSNGCSKLSIISLHASENELELNKFPNAPIKKFYMRRDLNLVTDWMPDLVKLYIGKDVTNIKSGSFESCSVISELEMEDGTGFVDLGKIPVNNVVSFYQGRNIHLATLAAWVKATNVFSSLKEWTVGECVDSICDNFACGNSYLEEISLPNNVRYVGKNAFCNNENLRSFVFPESITSVADGIFNGDGQLEKVSIPNSVKSIGEEAFRGVNIKHLKLPKNLESIGRMAFGECPIDSIVLPQGCTLELQCFYASKIKYADVSKMRGELNLSFAYCKELEEILLPETGITEIAREEFWEDHSLQNIVLPNSITKIGSSAFERTSLEKLEIPESVTEVENMILGTPSKVPSVYIPGNLGSKKITMQDSFLGNWFDGNMSLNTLQINRNFRYESSLHFNTDVIVSIDSLIVGAINTLEIIPATEHNDHFAPTTAICLSPYLTSCDHWKPANGKIFVLPGSRLPKEDIAEMYTVNKLTYELPADGNVFFDGVNNMPYEIVPVFYREDEEVELKEAGDYDLSMKISGTSFDGIYPTGLKVTVVSTTGIDNVTMDEDNKRCPIYNMNGQRVDERYKGIVIQNGKKRIVK